MVKSFKTDDSLKKPKKAKHSMNVNLEVVLLIEDKLWNISSIFQH